MPVMVNLLTFRVFWSSWEVIQIDDFIVTVDIGSSPVEGTICIEASKLHYLWFYDDCR